MRPEWAFDGAVGESGKDLGQVLADRKSESAAAFDDGEDCRNLGASFLASKMHPVFPTDGHRSHGVFGQVIR